MRKPFEAQALGEISEITPDVLKTYQDDFYKRILDADGNIDISKDAFLEGMYKEATLTTELTGFSRSLDQLFNEYPLIKPFFLFARTGINGLNLTYKNTPLFGALHRKSLDVMRATADDLTLVRKYGITSAADLANEKALFCRFHTQTGGSTLTANQIDNNVVRTTIQALSAVLGGTQSLHTNSRDEALALPSEDAAELALRTQQIICLLYTSPSPRDS